ncbi:MAG: hypothetical protein HQM11_08535 [SAR324 cluster bacterium]|nr:hypothetical protein [SAR324 cluster bacterium]
MSQKNATIIRPIPHFKNVRESASPQARLKSVKEACQGFRKEMLAEDPVVYYKSCSLIRVPYPSRYGFSGACLVPTPFIHILNRLFILQFQTSEGIKTLLASPSDLEGNAETPFFKRLQDSMGPLKSLGQQFLAPTISTVEHCLAQVGITPEQVDYITYDHLHTQDIRKWLGSHGNPGHFPNAKLLVMRQEWESTKALLPPQADWYCPQGIDGVDPERIILLDGDVMLGEGVALIYTPGHTEGNHSIVAHTPEGLMVTSENGVGPDAYAPLASKIPGLRRYSEATGVEVILNGNTLERGLDQYISMIQEREIAGRSVRNPDFYNMVCSSEATAYWAFPGIHPTWNFGDLQFGKVFRP